MPEKPNLFVVGAAKSGTSWIHTALGQHPEVFMSCKKEPNFFGSDLQFRAPRVRASEYLEMFSAGSGKKFRGESSVSYLLSRTAAEQIKELQREAMIIIMVRNPIEIMHGMHMELVRAVEEDLLDFEDALDAESDRRRGFRIPKYIRCVNWLFYRDWARLAEQVARFYDVFGRDRVFVGVYDDLANEPKAFYSSLLEFLRLPFSAPVSYASVNAKGTVRSRWLSQILCAKIPSPAKSAVTSLIPSKDLRSKIRSRLNWLNATTKGVKPMNPDLRRKLAGDCLAEVKALSKLLGRDLSAWLHAAQPGTEGTSVNGVVQRVGNEGLLRQ